MKKRFELWEEDLDDSPYFFDWAAHREMIAANQTPKVRSHVTAKWSQDDLDRLTDMWNAQVHTVKIAKALGKTKNAVIGKAARIGLPRRDPKDFNVPSGIVVMQMAA